MISEDTDQVKENECITNENEEKQGVSKENEEKESVTNENENKKEVFKKPVLIGKIGKLPKKIVNVAPSTSTDSYVEPLQQNETETADRVVEKCKDSSANKTKPSTLPSSDNIPLPYKEPEWSGLPDNSGFPYQFDVLKDGSIIETIDLMKKQFFVFGRLPNCHITMQHPTISRYHAILQYRATESETDQKGFYIYDLGSTHGTFLNKNNLRPKVFTKVHVGHILKFGCSSRMYLLNGPEEDTEMESELSVTELKEKRAEEIRKFQEAQLRRQEELEEMHRKEEEKGVDWGMGEDADEETDLSENPYAQMANEELYLDDPKKTLRGFFEREGLDLEYDCSEQGFGQFLCKVELPVDDERGRPIYAEVLHKGKKKEAVIQCALEACRILDRHGLLRQAAHESRKRKGKNWEENDYYDSDEDTFLDRTGAIEKKREKRMQAKVPQKAETYESLMAKEQEISKKIKELEKQVSEAQKKMSAEANATNEEDSLDSFMKQLKQSKPDKQSVNKLKLEISNKKLEHANIVRLVNIARPASLPPLVPQNVSQPSTSGIATKNKALPVFGKRRKIKVQLPARPPQNEPSSSVNMDGDEDEEDEATGKTEEKSSNAISVSKNAVPGSSKDGETKQSNNPSDVTEQNNDSSDVCMSTSSGRLERDGNSSEENVYSDSSSSSEENLDRISDPDRYNILTFRKFEKLLSSNSIPRFQEHHQDKLEKILNNLKKLATDEDRMHIDWKTLLAKKRKVMKVVADMKQCDEPDEKMENRVSFELKRILNELNMMMEQKYKVIREVKKMGQQIKTIADDVNKKYIQPKDGSHASTSRQVSNESDDKDDKEYKEQDERKKKKNMRRIQQRHDRAELERQRAYQEDANREDYNMWVPPSDQSGDGRTSLNDRLGY